jgi:hypothetical protein
MAKACGNVASRLSLFVDVIDSRAGFQKNVCDLGTPLSRGVHQRWQIAHCLTNVHWRQHHDSKAKTG